jgi:crossover junction endodeoxyribonuclease RuvC
MELEKEVKGMRFVGLDPSTKTGFVALDQQGNVLRAKELTGVGSQDPKRMVTLLDEVMDHIQPEDVIALEGFAFGAKGQGVSVQYGIGHGIRNSLYRKILSFYEIAPSAVKKYATGKGNTKKDEMVLPIFKKWGFEHSSDNVRDAYVMARIALNIWRVNNFMLQLDIAKYQLEVIEAVCKGKGK